jgi:hypothetical protein
LGFTALVKGIGFGAVLVLAVVIGNLLCQRPLATPRRLYFPAGWALMLLIALSWPILMLMKHGHGALSLWTAHVADRLIRQEGPGPFASEPWWEYSFALLAQALPWAPFALAGAWRSLARACLAGNGTKSGAASQLPAMVIAGDRFLWIWAVVPVGLLALAPVKNAHYVIAAQVPWSIWAALALARLGEQLRIQGYDRQLLILVRSLLFPVLSLAYGLGLWFVGPHFDYHGVEGAFYETAGHQIPASMPLSLLYDEWDRNPYESPFGPIPHDLAVRLFYLARPACWHSKPGPLQADEHVESRLTPLTSCLLGEECPMVLKGLPVAVIGRDRDLPGLEKIGHVQVIARGPNLRRDRTYSLFCITSDLVESKAAGRLRTRALY